MPQQTLLVAETIQQHCEVVMRIRIRRIEFETALVTSLRIIDTPHAFERDRAIEMKHGILGEV